MLHHQEHPKRHVLHLEELGKSAVVTGPVGESLQVKLTDPATFVMTDFMERAFFKVAPDEQIDRVLEKMKNAGVRSAFVMDSLGDKLLGMITAYDIMGEKPLRYLQSSGFTEHRDILVSDIMESVKDMVAVDMHEVAKESVQSVLDVLQQSRRTHLPVVEKKEGEAPHLRGLFSTTRVLRLTEDARRTITRVK
ncbi:MAG TPA: CBS domain-containing protein [Gallionella sp.]